MREVAAGWGASASSRAAVAAALLAALLGGCAQRERLNPLDPKNTATGGKIAGFEALAGNGQVEIRWTRLTQKDVGGYGLLRWRPGEAPRYVGDTYAAYFAGTVDSEVTNGDTYIYRLVAFFTSGDSAVSPVDSATPGTRKIAVLSAGVPGLVGLTPDARRILYVLGTQEAYEDMELDTTRAILWLTMPEAGWVRRIYFDGTPAAATIVRPHPADVSVSNLRGVGWIAFPDERVVRAFGPSGSDTVIASVGETHVVEAGTLDPAVWIGNQVGTVYRFSLPDPDPVLLGVWSLDAPVTAIALDEAMKRAWVATRTSSGDVLYVIDSVDSTVTKVPVLWSNIADLAFDAATPSLWVSDRGIPRGGNGQLARLSRSAAILASIGGIEPYGIMADPTTGNCWASELRSGRLIEVTPGGAIVRRSASINVPYAVRVTGGP